MIESTAFKRAMRYLPSAVGIVAAQWSGSRTGMTATALCSLSAEPPMLLICVNRMARSCDKIRRSGRFTVNLLSADDYQIAEQFATGDMDVRFRSGVWTELPSGALALQSAFATFDCALAGDIPVATHSIFLGNVEDLILRTNREALIYVDGQYAKVAPRRA